MELAVRTTVHSLILVTHLRRMEIQRQPNQLLHPQPIQIMYKYQQRVPLKQPQVRMHPQFQVPNNQVQQQQPLHNRRSKARNNSRHNNRNRLNQVIKATVTDTGAVIEEEVLVFVGEVEVEADITLVRPWDKITTVKIVMAKVVIDKGHLWEVPLQVVAEAAVTIQISVVRNTIRDNRQIQQQ